MGSNEIGWFFIMLFVANSCLLVLSSSPLCQESSDITQGKNFPSKTTHEQSSNIKHRIGYASGGGGGSRQVNPGDRGSNGGSRTPSTQGGTTFIPVYAAGAASNRHPNHRGAAGCNRIETPALVGVAVASFLQVYAAFRRG